MEKIKNVLPGVMDGIEAGLKAAPCSVCGAVCAVVCDWDGYRPKCTYDTAHIEHITDDTWSGAIMKWNRANRLTGAEANLKRKIRFTEPPFTDATGDREVK